MSKSIFPSSYNCKIAVAVNNLLTEPAGNIVSSGLTELLDSKLLYPYPILKTSLLSLTTTTDAPGTEYFSIFLLK